MLPLLFVVGGALLIGGAILVSSKSTTSDRPPAGANWRQGPNGRGRIYGEPNAAILSAFWTSPDVMFGCGPDGLWIAEGANFLPKVTRHVDPRRGLAGPTAWGYVEFQLRTFKDARGAAQSLLDQVATMEVKQALLGCSGTAIGERWGEDVIERVRKYAELPSK